MKLLETTARRPTDAEAVAMWREWKTNGNQSARDRLVLSYSPMVNYIASKKIRELPPHFELDDLVSSGLLALVQAVERYDPAKGATFEQYAWTRVAGAIVDELRARDGASRAARRMGRDIDRVREKFSARYSREPSQIELAEELQVPVAEVRDRMHEIEAADVLSLNSPVAAGDEATAIELGDTLESPSVEGDPERAVLAGERAAAIRKAVSALPERERQILRMLHVEQRKAVEIGEILGVSESRISQILSAIRQKLQEQVTAYERAAEMPPARAA